MSPIDLFFLGLFFLVGLICGPLALWSIVGDTVGRMRIKRHGITVTGQITKHVDSFGGRGLTYYYLVYTYSHNGKHYRKKQEVREEDFRRLDDGMRIAVRCLADHPQVAVLAGVEGFQARAIIVAAISYFVVLSGVLYWFHR